MSDYSAVNPPAEKNQSQAFAAALQRAKEVSSRMLKARTMVKVAKRARDVHVVLSMAVRINMRRLARLCESQHPVLMRVRDRPCHSVRFQAMAAAKGGNCLLARLGVTYVAELLAHLCSQFTWLNSTRYNDLLLGVLRTVPVGLYYSNHVVSI